MALACRLVPPQGHMDATVFVGGIYDWGQGVAVDYPRAMAAYKVGGEGGHAVSQYMVGMMYYVGRGVDVDYAQALLWIEKAAAQDQPQAVGQLGGMYFEGKGVTPSFRRAREHLERATELGNSIAVESMQTLTETIQMVTSRRSNHSALSSPLVRDLALPYLASLSLHTCRASWTSGWRSTARAGRT